MQTWLKFCLALLGLVVVLAIKPPAAIGLPGDGIGTTAHDFTSTGPVGFQGPAGTGMCETCHVPHNSGSAQLMWNQTLGAASTFGAGAATAAGTSLPANIKTWTGTSKNCLSCHDGSVAVGTGWSTPGSTKISGTTQIGDATGDLSGNHPVAVPYAGETGKYNNIQSGYTSRPASWSDPATISGVKLHKDPTTGAYGLECASCHDPHNKDAADAKFLRVATGSICTACHAK